MSYRDGLLTLLRVAFLLAVVALIVGQALGQPILLSYVETGSMEPTMEPGDGFVAIPPELAGEIESGDVVVFRAREIQGGGLTTHRVVGETDRGYVTRGDANPFTDQDGGEPPVAEAEIVAVAWQPGGEVLVLPGLGTAVEAVRGGLEAGQRRLAAALGTRALLGTQGIAVLLFALSMAAYAIDWWLSSGGRDRERTTDRESGTSVRLVLVGLAAVVVIAATASMVVPAGTHEVGIVSAEFDSDSPTVIPQGESTEVNYTVPNGGFLPVYVYFEPASDGVAVSPDRLAVPGRGSANVTFTLSAPPETGYYRLFVEEHRYLGVLPESVIADLYAVHPWAPIVTIDALLGGGFYALGAAALGGIGGRIRSRDRSRPTGRLPDWLP